MARLTEAIRRKLHPEVSERTQAINERHHITEMIARGLPMATPTGEPIQVRLVNHDLVGPLGGMSDKITIQVGADRQTARFYYVNIYANGVMADD